MQAFSLRRLVGSLAGCLLALAFSCAARAGDGQAPLWRSISDGLHRNIEIKRQELNRIRKALPADTAALDTALGDVSSRLDQILLLRGVAGETPWASRSLLMQLRELTAAVDVACEPLRDMRDALARTKQEYAVLRQIRARNASREYAELVSEELSGPGREFKELKGDVDAVKAEVDASLAQATALDADIEVARQEEVDRFVALFKQTYFASSGSLLAVSGLAGMVDDFFQWRNAAPRFWKPVASWTLWERYLAAAAAYCLLLLGVLHLCRRRFPAIGKRPLGPLVWIVAGLALFAGRQTVLFAANQFTSLAWVLAVSWGLVGMLGGGARLRTLFVCFAATAACDVGNVPASVAGATLPVLAAAAIWRLRRCGCGLTSDAVALAAAGVAGVFGYGPQGVALV
ncbi:MAG TPA: mechanosensitive ion channel protein, partial [Desulfovibrio sp.]|nr:mechanosensitive ion channel protein [Desulfovibrio sp.]